ncbi:2-keto-4-pentenoate hydratase/2-oxohepta-3-ene-1,7-dioic acid hydratase in catechol pathway [Actinokineospora baliensis]|uniref:fumarylacetoacetate hydrolase family protein n=1 Tax=Actinokineospora baliensis TaxID=547056 RepID=UPI00195F20DD|nr:fumarylacetoacetate hydrolase family protein [Actinokineospora baliensis]MBM7775514.1 2-keto-4-pentenoate hydratase/2-oxohepta-3-ene-1,7-dioic acid hydratase in catechol pathway [Actinokineospora baliensis]
MKVGRIRTGTGPRWVAYRDGSVFELDRPLGGTVGERLGTTAEFPLIAPCPPGKVVGAATNYLGSTDRYAGISEPMVFLKAATSVIGPGDPIVSPYQSETVVWGEAELAAVIGRRISGITPEQATEAVFGWTIGNDVTADNVDGRDHHLARSKSADTFCPLGPYIDTDYRIEGRRISGHLNDRLVTTGLTSDFFWDPYVLISRLSHWFTLEPFDVILTGHPPLVGSLPVMGPGDVYRARVEGFELDLVNPFHGSPAHTPEETGDAPAR